MGGLPHFTNTQAQQNLKTGYEPIYTNLFEVQIILPTSISEIGTFDPVLLEKCQKVNLPTYPGFTPVEQRYKYSTRLYIGMPDSTSNKDISVTFNVNQLQSGEMDTFSKMKKWYDLAWNNESGTLSYKHNMLGQIIIYQHDREGKIIRRVTNMNCQILSFTINSDLQWGGGNTISEVTAKFVADYWMDYYF